MNSLKKDLRREYRIIRKATQKREQKEKVIIDTLISSELFRNADCIFLYCSHDGEINTDRISFEAQKLEIKTAYPYCVDENGIMEFYFSVRENLKQGMYGIYEPDIEKCEKAVFTEKSLCIVPGISFGKTGERLGYGKGYYDRFLSTFKGKTVGLSFEECLSECIPMEKHDRKIDYLITDEKIYKIL